MATLGGELARLRRLKGWSLRDVEDRTKNRVSNSYLYQLENDNVKEPSPNILFLLSEVYEASYADLMKLAGFIVPGTRKESAARRQSVAFNALRLNSDEEQEVLDFVEFLRSKRGKRSR
jgi:HTH-type transcriptional regulator, competence development regulator